MIRIPAPPSRTRRSHQQSSRTAQIAAVPGTAPGTPATAVPAAVLLLLGSLLWIGFYLLHPPGEGVSVARTMQVAADSTVAWRLSHLGIAAGYVCGGVAALLVLVGRTRLAASATAATGWALMTIFCVPLAVYLVVESTVAADVAVAGDLDAFTQWYEGLAVGLWRFAWPAFFAGHALVAVGLLRSGVLPRWATLAAIAGAAVAMTAPAAPFVAPSVSLVPFITPVLSVLWMAWLAVALLRARRSQEGRLMDPAGS